MSEKLLDILKPQTGCIPEELLVRYAEGKLSAAEARRVEEHITECEFCSDALDGIMKGGNTRRFHAEISSIKKIVHKRMKIGEPGSNFPITRRLAIAATLMILAISAWYVQYMANDNSQKVFSEQFKPYPAIPEKEIQPKSAANESSSTASEPQRINQKQVLSNSKVKSDKKQDASESAETSEEGYQAERQSYADTARSTSESGVAKSPSPHNAPEQNKSAVGRSGGVAEKKDEYAANELTDANFNNGMEYYESNRYAEAIAEFQLVITQEPDHPAANFYSGVSALALNNPDEALKYFSKTDYKTNPFCEASLWYEALAYIHKNDKEQAKGILEKVISLNGDYRVKATETLKEL